MTQGKYCESCGWFHDHTQTCLFVDNRGGCSNVQDTVVDCTLSLGTPSTRLSERDMKKKRRSSNSFSRVSTSLETNKNTSKTSTYSVLPFSNRRILGGGDTLLDRRCTNCDTTSTPLWRNGPRGPKSLCNACGIRFKKEEKRTINPVATAGSTGAQDQYGQHHSSYSNYIDVENGSSSACNFVASEIMLNHDYYGGAGEYYRRDPVDGVNGLTANTWRLNVADTATSLVYDFTR